eukprot:m.1406702 g.1406702  ORF g.1406702 m.1406702 type:complete len:324 (-) comp25014_c0_seq13:1870-2841(-)
MLASRSLIIQCASRLARAPGGSCNKRTLWGMASQPAAPGQLQLASSRAAHNSSEGGGFAAIAVGIGASLVAIAHGRVSATAESADDGKGAAVPKQKPNPKESAVHQAHPASRHRTIPAGQWDPNWDFKGDRPTKGVRYLVLVRHGQYDMEDPTHPLTPLGREQAAAAAKRLVALGYKFKDIHCSDMLRAKQTCDIIADEFPGVPVFVNQLIAEGAPIPPEPTHSSWQPSPDEFFREGARIEAGFRHFFQRPDDDEKTYQLLVCHGNVIRYSVLRALQLPPEAWLRISHVNCGITIMRISGKGSVSLMGLGDAGHLSPDQVSFN